MAGNPIYIYDSSETSGSDFDRLGDPGKYYKSQTVADGQTDYTGSNYGYGSVIVNTHGSAIFHLSSGGSIAAANLTAGVVYDLSLAKITAASSATIYVMKKQTGF
jgi:hypothetical protein